MGEKLGMIRLDRMGLPLARRMFERAEATGWGKDDASRVLEVYQGKDGKA